MSETARPLTPGERALARSVFGDALDCDRVSINRRRWWPLQPKPYAMAPDGHLWFHPQGHLWRDDFGAADLGLQGLFIHELVHVWQHQKGMNLILRRHPFCRYSYVLHPGWPLRRYGIEQQAEIVRHAWLLRGGHVVPGAPPLAQYESMLPFRPIRFG